MATELGSNPDGHHKRENELSSSTEFSKWPSRSRSPDARITVKNRRKRYLDTHPEYFSSPSLELSDPLAYDRLVRRFQSPTEREAEGRKKGYSGMLEADLWRSEAKVDAFASSERTASMNHSGDASGVVVAEENDEVPENKDEGMQRWRKEMELMFMRGAAPEFDYKQVDGSEEYDDRALQEREAEERWFEKEEPRWVEGNDQSSSSLTGQTGIQDY